MDIIRQLESEEIKRLGKEIPEFSAGDTVDEALLNASEAVLLYAESLAKEGKPLPAPRSVTTLREDPEVASDLRDHVVALVPYEADAARAAE